MPESCAGVGIISMQPPGRGERRGGRAAAGRKWPPTATGGGPDRGARPSRSRWTGLLLAARRCPGRDSKLPSPWRRPAPDQKAWMPPSCSNSNLNEASTPYSASQAGRRAGGGTSHATWSRTPGTPQATARPAPAATQDLRSAQDHAFGGLGRRGVRKAHHTEGIEQPKAAGQDRDEKCHLKG